MKLFVIVAGLLLFGNLVAAQTVCSDANLRTSPILTTIRSLEDFKPEQTSDLLMVGEMHYLTDPILLQKILRILAKEKGENACVFFEFSSAVTPHDFVSKVKDALASLPEGDSVERRDFSEMLRYYGPLITTADELGLKSLSIDHPENFGQGMELNLRDEAMAQRIQSLLRNGSCSSAVMFIGKAHITADEDGIYTLKHRLRDAKLKLTTFNVQHASDPGPQKLAAWSQLCPQNTLLTPDGPMIFRNDLFSDTTPIWPRMIGGKWTGGLWRDFEYTILAP